MSKQEPSPERSESTTTSASSTPCVDASSSPPVRSGVLSNAELTQEKEVAFYSAVTNAWIGTRMEQDKSLLSLGVAGIGLLVTLLSTIGAKSPFEAILFGLAILSFATTTLLIAYIFRVNADLLRGCVENTDAGDTTGHLTQRLKLLDKVVLGSFAVGILLSSTIGGTQVIRTFNTKGSAMADRDEKQNQVPTPDKIKSLAGIEKLRPTPTPSVPSTPPQQGSGSKQEGPGTSASEPKPAQRPKK